MLSLWYSDIYSAGIDAKARFPRQRYQMLYRMLQVLGKRIVFQDAPKIDRDVVELAHCDRYVERFLTSTLSDREVRRIGLRPWTPSMIPRTLTLLGGTLAATKHAFHYGIAGNLAGGTHHAHYDYGSGYCIFNDLAVSARYVQQMGCQRVLIIDLDVHQGDGTASIFQDDPSVFTFSMHCEKNFPFRKQKSDVDVPLEEKLEDEEYLRILEKSLPPVIETFKPDFIFYQAGVDGLKSDRLGRLSLSKEGLRTRNHYIYEMVAKLNVPIVITIGGGYSDPLLSSVECHTDVFIQASSFL
ncbi:MAG: histone deacetylase [Myxococcota bacterium]|nr:histone deacetylase [Myxococcota bacterium]